MCAIFQEKLEDTNRVIRIHKGRRRTGRKRKRAKKKE
jgi:hypothetical protein